MQKKLCVVIPTRNENETLIALLKCLSNQSYKHFDLVIADYSNSSDVRNICIDYKIDYIIGGHPGKGRNNGALHTNSDYILFLDADIIISDDFILNAITLMRYKKVDCISFGFVASTNNITLYVLHWLAKYLFYTLTKIGISHGIGGAILVKRHVHVSVDGFDESITVAEDQDYLMRVSRDFKYFFSLNPYVYVNVRRFIAEGIFILTFKYLFIQLHRLILGEIRKEQIPYFRK